MTKEHQEFFSERSVNIIFDEYRMVIYFSNRESIRKKYIVAKGVEGIDEFIRLSLADTHNRYKYLYLYAFIKKSIMLPRLLYMYSVLREK